jgi:predicted DNA-binding transcriptional regulator YafY
MFVLVLSCIFAVTWLWLRSKASPPSRTSSNLTTPQSTVHISSRVQTSRKARAARHRPVSRLARTHISLINEAIASKKNVSFRYKKKDGSITERTVTPRKVRRLSTSEMRSIKGFDAPIYGEGPLCMFGHCHLRNAARTFSLERIQNLRLE